MQLRTTMCESTRERGCPHYLGRQATPRPASRTGKDSSPDAFWPYLDFLEEGGARACRTEDTARRFADR